MASAKAWAPMPRLLTAPSPVTTTRRRGARSGIVTLLIGVTLDEDQDGVHVEHLGEGLVRDPHAHVPFDAGDDVDGQHRVGAVVVDEVAGLREVVRLDLEDIDEDVA